MRVNICDWSLNPHRHRQLGLSSRVPRKEIFFIFRGREGISECAESNKKTNFLHSVAFGWCHVWMMTWEKGRSGRQTCENKMSKSIICHTNSCVCLCFCFNVCKKQEAFCRRGIHPLPLVITVIKSQRSVREGNPLYNLPLKDRIFCMTHVMKFSNETRCGWCGERQTEALMMINMRRLALSNRKFWYIYMMGAAAIQIVKLSSIYHGFPVMYSIGTMKSAALLSKHKT